MVVEGFGHGRDYKLGPGGGREWNGSETDIHHDPGFQPRDIEELLAKGREIIVLSRGIAF